ncbi:hypothetical protein SAY87_028636 [Trapa incisa]|uniref:Uncharacterized protein n=1 Tax=Trapa incisa TaxID=236973 RepID=A0AAN7L334_9MYRT|nr:hypothetical protein SAY87_028636 [Trapa incisa]
MVEVLTLPSPASSTASPSPSCTLTDNVADEEAVDAQRGDGGGGGDQLSFLALLFTIFRKSWIACNSDRRRLCEVEIGWPSNVRHVAHVTFDRFNGFLGLPVELEHDLIRRAPSASAHVFGVSTESMQLSFDSRGNSVPTILLLMQQRLYEEGGLQAEGIFRINAENGQEEPVRDQLNRGIVPEGIDVHCLAGLIKTWFRELPMGILDSLPPERVMQCQTEEDCVELVRFLPRTEACLFDWAINLMTDVAQMEHLNKMNARNIAVVFAPNMTQMADPFTALMYAVQVMNFLKALIERTLKEREDFRVDPASAHNLGHFDENGRESPSEHCVGDDKKDDEEIVQPCFAEEPIPHLWDDNISSVSQETCQSDSFEQLIADGDENRTVMEADNYFIPKREPERFNSLDGTKEESEKRIWFPWDEPNESHPSKMVGHNQPMDELPVTLDKSQVMSGLSRIELRMAMLETWRNMVQYPSVLLFYTDGEKQSWPPVSTMEGRRVVVSALQFACTDDVSTNVTTVERLVRAAHSKGANIILIQELFEGYYFCQAQREDFFKRAKPYKNHPTIMRMQKLAKELGVQNIPGNSCSHWTISQMVLGARKNSTSTQVFQTKFAKIGVAICWDQWFPEAARAMVLHGTEILLYPTAMAPNLKMVGLIRVITGRESCRAMLEPIWYTREHGNSEITFYGNFFIAGPTGEIVASADDKNEDILVAEFDLDKIKTKRHSWGVFRDRRPDLYTVLLTSDGIKP